MSSPQTQTTSDLQAVADALRSNDRFLLVTHENPDGDALGSLLATKLALDALGKDSVMYLYGDAPLPREYGFMELSGIRREPPDDAAERVLVALDCANETRMAPDTDAPRERAADARHRPPSRQLALRRAQPGRRRRLLDRRGAARPVRASWASS